MSLRTAITGIAIASVFTATLGAMPDAASGRWTLAAPLPEPRWFHAAGLGSDERLYVYGGYVKTDRPARAYGIGPLALVIYDPSSHEWNRGPANRAFQQRTRYQVVASTVRADGTNVEEIQLRDGFSESATDRELFSGDQAPAGHPHWFAVSSAGAIYFDPEKGDWTQKLSPGLVAPPEPPRKESARDSSAPRQYLGTWPVWFRFIATAATSSDGKIYLTGGTGKPIEFERRSEGPQLLAAVDVYDAVANRWYAIPPMREARQLHAAAVGRDGRLYVFGGVASPGGIGSKPGESDESWERRMAANRKAADSSLASVEIYDPKTESWSKGAPMPTPRQAMGAALGSDGRIYVVGGTKSYSTPDPLDTVEIYDPATDSWEKGPSLLYPRRGHAVVATPDGKIYAIGGWVWSRKLRLPTSDAPRFEEDGKDLRATVEVLDTKASD